jgi:hypothetical protein
MNRRSLLGAAVALPVSSVAAQGTPTAADNLATARGFLADVQAGFNAEAARQYISPDYDSGTPGNAPGIDAYIQRLGGYVEMMRHTFTEYAIVETAHVARGSVVAILARSQGAATTGRTVDVEAVWWFDFDAAGLITHFAGGPDSQKMNQAIYG